MTSKKYISGLLFVALAAVASTGCGPSAARSTEAAADHKASDAGSAATESAVYPASDYSEQTKGIQGGTLRATMAYETASLDFHAIAVTDAQWIGRLLCDNLVYLDEKGEISPWLAKSWTISPDGKTYTFHLRDDVTFSDGAKFDAEAVRINLEHMRDPATKSPLAGVYIAPYLAGKVIDEYTFQATLRDPYSPFLNVLAQSWLTIMSPKAIRENPKKLAESPIGSGPFVLERFTRQQGLRFVKRKDYHWAPPVLKHEGPAYLDRIEVDFVAEAIVRYNSLGAGQYDFTFDAPPQNAAAIRADSSLVFSSRIRQGNPARALAFNTEREPFTDLQVRRAVAAAIDREGDVQIVGFGEFKPKTDFLSITTRYYDPSYRDILTYDVAAANRLLDTAGWTGKDSQGYRTKGGKRLSAEVLFSERSGPQALFAALQSDLKKVGFELRLTTLPLGQMQERRLKGDYDAVAAGVWHTNTPDGLYILYHSSEIATEKRVGQNSSRLRDEELDGLLDGARRSNDPVVLRDLYSKAQKRLIDLVPAVPLYENHSVIAYRDQVKGVVFDTSHNTPIFTTVWLAKETQ